jgi:hypothetical protein
LPTQLGRSVPGDLTMLLFFRPTQSHQPAPAMQQALIKSGLPDAVHPALLLVLQQRGVYAGGHARYVRVFDPVRSAEWAISIQHVDDLARHPELILGSGHAERDGSLIVSRRERVNLPASLQALQPIESSTRMTKR